MQLRALAAMLAILFGHGAILAERAHSQVVVSDGAELQAAIDALVSGMPTTIQFANDIVLDGSLELSNDTVNLDGGGFGLQTPGSSIVVRESDVQFQNITVDSLVFIDQDEVVVDGAGETVLTEIVDRGFGTRITKRGSGQLTVQGDNSDFAGRFNVINGEFRLADAQLPFLRESSVFSSGLISGEGYLGGNSLVFGRVRPGGQGPGLLRFHSLELPSSSVTEFELGRPDGDPGSDGDLIVVENRLTMAGGGIQVIALDAFGPGSYPLFQYGSASFTFDNQRHPRLVGVPAGFAYSLNLGDDTDRVVSLEVSTEGLQFWVGGTGEWQSDIANWTTSDGLTTENWKGQTAVFGGPTGGDVNIDNQQSITGLQFMTDGYRLRDAFFGELFVYQPTDILADPGVTANIDAPIRGDGTLLLTGEGRINLNSPNNQYTGGTELWLGTLGLGHRSALGSGPLLIAGGTLAPGADFRASSLNNAFTIINDFTVDLNANRFFTFQGQGTVEEGQHTVELLGENGFLTFNETLQGEGELVFNTSAEQMEVTLPRISTRSAPRNRQRFRRQYSADP